MVPAMDRESKTSARRLWVGLGLALCLTGPGCSRLKSQLWNETPAASIGQTMDTADIYAQAGRSRATATIPTSLPDGAEAPSPMIARVEEVGAAIRPAESNLDPSATGVALQAPTTLDARTGPKLASATTGVPNASRLLASGERPSETKPTADPRQVVAEARAAIDSMASYEVAMHRQERAGGSLQPEEDVVLAVCREPRGVRLSWPSGPNRGREVLYRADEPGGQMHVKMANPALPRLSFAPDSPMVMRNSRHPIAEAGFDSLVEGLESALKAPDAYGLTCTGPETPSGLDQPHLCLVRTTAAGENWKVYIDPRTHLPALVQAVDAKGELLERYVFQDVHPDPPELASADAFDATARWGAPKGLFGRISQVKPADPDPSPR